MTKATDDWTDEDIDNFIRENGQDPEVIREPFKRYFQALKALDQHVKGLALACKLYYNEAEKAKEGNEQIS